MWGKTITVGLSVDGKRVADTTLGIEQVKRLGRVPMLFLCADLGGIVYA